MRDQPVADYSAYITSFINIRDRAIQDKAQSELRAGALWPDPLIQLNPAFEPGAWIDDLVDERTLHEECRRVFRIKPDSESAGKPLRLHHHQMEAIYAAPTWANDVLSTGTGTGKSLAHIVPIVDHVLRRGPGPGPAGWPPQEA